MSNVSDRRLADRALATHYALAGLNENSPWVRVINQSLFGDDEDRAGPRLPGHLIPARAKEAANEALTYAVSTDMAEAIKEGAEALLEEWVGGNDEPEVLLPYDVPVEAGFVYFPHAIVLDLPEGSSPVIDGGDERIRTSSIPVTGITWRSHGDGLAFWPVSASREPWWDYFLDKAKGRIAGSPPEIIVHDEAGWFFDQPWIVDPSLEAGSVMVQDAGGTRIMPTVGAIDRAILWTFFRLVEQKIPREGRIRPSRDEMRRITRKRPDFTRTALDDGEVRLITLRRESTPSDGEPTEGHEPTWSHRWTVRPHWARRRVAKRDDEGNVVGSTRGVRGVDWDYRRVYIQGFIKGPDDRPLKIKDTVGVLKR